MTSARTEHRLRLATLVLLTTITAIISSLGAPLVPAIARQYDVALTTAQWALTAAFLTGAVATPIVGRLASGRLRRPTILAGLVVVTAGCVLAALPLGFASLVTGRSLQGVGMALVPLAIAVARDVTPGHRLAGVVALLSVSTVAGAGLGYPLTALVADVGGLHAAYWFGAVLTALTLAMAVRFVPGARGEAAQRVDWLGAGWLSAGMVALLLAVSRGNVWGWATPRTIGLAALGAALLAGWVAWTRHRDDPLVDLRLATRPGLAGPNLVAIVAGTGMYTQLTLVVVVVQSDEPGLGLGLPVTVAGLMLVPYALMSVLGARAAAVVGARLGTGVLLPLGCGIFFSASVGLALGHGSVWLLVVWMALGGIGSGFTFSSLAVLMVPHVPPAETGSAMAFNQVLRYLGFAVGSATSVALVAVFGGGDTGYRTTLLLAAGLWVVAGVGAWWLQRTAPPTSETEPTAGPASAQ